MNDQRINGAFERGKVLQQQQIPVRWRHNRAKETFTDRHLLLIQH